MPAAVPEPTGPSDDGYDDTVPGSLFQDREAPREYVEIEGTTDDWPGIDGTPDDIPAEPVAIRRR